MRKILTFRPKCPICGKRPRMLIDRAADNRNIILYRAFCCAAMIAPYGMDEGHANRLWKDRVKEYQEKK